MRKRFGTAGILAALIGFWAFSPAQAQRLAEYDYEDLEFRGVGFDVGRVWPAQVQPTTSYGLRLDLGFVGPRVRIVPTARFWSSSLRQEEVTRLADQIVLVCERQGDATCPEELNLGQVDLSDLELATDAHFLLLTGQPVRPYLGLSLGLHLLNGRGDFIDDTFVEDLLDTIAPGIGSVLGLTVDLSRSLQLNGEARVMLASDVRYGNVSIGGSWLLPAPGVDETIALKRRARR